MTKPIDFSQYFTEETKRRGESPLKALLKYMLADPQLISLGGGLPNPSLFPFNSVTAEVVSPGSNPAQNLEPLTVTVDRYAKKDSVTEPLSTLLQYGGGVGAKSMIDFIYQHMKDVHNPKYEGWGVISSVGSTDSLNKAIEIFATAGDSIIVCEWSYPSAIETFTASGLKMAPVKMDGEGMIPEDLDLVCSNWTEARPPRLVYLIPTGQNPTGATMSVSRRHEFYKVCQKHDLIVIEDDPYYFLQFADAPVVSAEEETDEYFAKLPGTKNLMPSILSIDTDGRVLRLDTVSKILAPNMRQGWVTGQSALIKRIQYHNETTIQQPCGFTQGIASKLLNEVWGHEGFLKHLLSLQYEYISRRNAIMYAIQQNLGNMVSYTVPVGGMFVWLKVNLPEDIRSKPGIMEEVFQSMIENQVMLVPGWQFSPATDQTPVKDAPYFRAAFSFASKEELTTAIERLAIALARFGCKK
ncbi:hypothetical protein BB559_001900 [Furculomyces boomerangus]|uniref:Aminotransferase class I/classII large domain-containing protein n=2 Tax=Harpellales TaxID=61421 RepID=A0A2T9YZM6_9FUNG|nr:hypothetical protein BB559_001900 [Furculomyces boomerangus]PVZ98467.1 hypothetical protein BB558_005529 [Smittium angustum]PWA02346.1 hypothetical protein BB558_001516 [Smittium angustum]